MQNKYEFTFKEKNLIIKINIECVDHYFEPCLTRSLSNKPEEKAEVFSDFNACAKYLEQWQDTEEFLSLRTKYDEMLAARKEKMRQHIIIAYDEAKLGGYPVHHGTEERHIDSVIKGPKNEKSSGNMLAGPGLYIDPKQAVAHEYALDYSNKGAVLNGFFNAQPSKKNCYVARISIITQISRCNYEKGIFRQDWTKEPGLLTFIQQHADIIDISVNSEQLPTRSDHFYLIRESAGPDIVNWSEVKISPKSTFAPKENAQNIRITHSLEKKIVSETKSLAKPSHSTSQLLNSIDSPNIKIPQQLPPTSPQITYKPKAEILAQAPDSPLPILLSYKPQEKILNKTSTHTLNSQHPIPLPDKSKGNIFAESSVRTSNSQPPKIAKPPIEVLDTIPWRPAITSRRKAPILRRINWSNVSQYLKIISYPPLAIWDYKNSMEYIKHQFPQYSDEAAKIGAVSNMLIDEGIMAALGPIAPAYILIDIMGDIAYGIKDIDPRDLRNNRDFLKRMIDCYDLSPGAAKILMGEFDRGDKMPRDFNEYSAAQVKTLSKPFALFHSIKRKAIEGVLLYVDAYQELKEYIDAAQRALDGDENALKNIKSSKYKFVYKPGVTTATEVQEPSLTVNLTILGLSENKENTEYNNKVAEENQQDGGAEQATINLAEADLFDHNEYNPQASEENSQDGVEAQLHNEQPMDTFPTKHVTAFIQEKPKKPVLNRVESGNVAGKPGFIINLAGGKGRVGFTATPNSVLVQATATFGTGFFAALGSSMAVASVLTGLLIPVLYFLGKHKKRLSEQIKRSFEHTNADLEQINGAWADLLQKLPSELLTNSPQWEKQAKDLLAFIANKISCEQDRVDYAQKYKNVQAGEVHKSVIKNYQDLSKEIKRTIRLRPLFKEAQEEALIGNYFNAIKHMEDLLEQELGVNGVVNETQLKEILEDFDFKHQEQIVNELSKPFLHALKSYAQGIKSAAYRKTALACLESVNTIQRVTPEALTLALQALGVLTQIGEVNKEKLTRNIQKTLATVNPFADNFKWLSYRTLSVLSTTLDYLPLKKLLAEQSLLFKTLDYTRATLHYGMPVYVSSTLLRSITRTHKLSPHSALDLTNHLINLGFFAANQYQSTHGNSIEAPWYYRLQEGFAVLTGMVSAAVAADEAAQRLEWKDESRVKLGGITALVTGGLGLYHLCCETSVQEAARQALMAALGNIDYHQKQGICPQDAAVLSNPRIKASWENLGAILKNTFGGLAYAPTQLAEVNAARIAYCLLEVQNDFALKKYDQVIRHTETAEPGKSFISPTYKIPAHLAWEVIALRLRAQMQSKQRLLKFAEQFNEYYGYIIESEQLNGIALKAAQECLKCILAEGLDELIKLKAENPEKQLVQLRQILANNEYSNLLSDSQKQRTVMALKLLSKSTQAHSINEITSSEKTSLRQNWRFPEQLKIVDCGADGNCLFLSVASQVHGATHETLRQLTCVKLESKRNILTPFFTGTGIALKDRTGRDVRITNADEYIHLMAAPGTWGGEIELSILAGILNRPIATLSPGYKPLLYPSSISPTEQSLYEGEPIFIYYNGINHYQAFSVNTDISITPQEIFNSLLRQAEEQPEESTNSALVNLLSSPTQDRDTSTGKSIQVKRNKLNMTNEMQVSANTENIKLTSNPASFFNESNLRKQEKLKNYQFLNNVAKGRQKEAKDLLTIKSADTQTLLRTASTFTDYSGRTFHCTAYEYAYWAKDTHMCGMLAACMDSETKALMLKRIDAIDASGLTFQQNGTTHRCAHFDLTELIKALQDYVNGWDRIDKKDWVAMKAAWMKVGKAQRNVPAHVAQEYCRADRSFFPCPSFLNESALPRDLTIYNDTTDQYDCWFPLTSSNAGLGFDFGLVRNEKWSETCEAGLLGICAKGNLTAVTQLDKARTAELNLSREHLSSQAISHRMTKKENSSSCRIC